MRTFLVPNKFSNLFINGSGAYDCQAFQLPVPKLQESIIPVAGGDWFDFNYGAAPKYVPVPFTITMTCYGNDESAFGLAFNALFGTPNEGLYGLIRTFEARVHGTLTMLTCQARIESYSFVQDVGWYSSDKKLMAGMNVIFKPMDLFT